MSEEKTENKTENKTEFEQLREEKQLSLIQEFVLFLREEKKWWLLPIILVLALVSVLSLIGGSLPFIYTIS